MTTCAARDIGAEKLPGGSNVVMAVLSYTGYNQEDALIINATSGERGLFNSLNARSYFVTETEDERFDPRRAAATAPHIDRATGIVKQNASVRQGDPLVLMTSRDGTKRDTTVRRYEEGYVQRQPHLGVVYDEKRATRVEAAVQGGTAPAEPDAADTLLYTVVRVQKGKGPVVGDKFSTRHGQKGMCGLTLRAGDMPFSAEGVVPDVIINPHAFPSRMTVGQFLEGTFGLAGARLGCRSDGSLGDRPNLAVLGSGGRESGTVPRDGADTTLYDPRTGRSLSARVFVSPIFCRRLVQQVGTKMFYRSDDGRVHPMTHQPIRGRSSGGALRLGEMERDALLGHGVVSFQREAYTTKSDGRVRSGKRDRDGDGVPPDRAHELHLSATTGGRAVVNKRAGIVRDFLSNETGFDASVPGGRKLYDGVPVCDPTDGTVVASVAPARRTEVATTHAPRAASVFLDELTSMGMRVSLRTNHVGCGSGAPPAPHDDNDDREAPQPTPAVARRLVGQPLARWKRLARVLGEGTRMQPILVVPEPTTDAGSIAARGGYARAGKLLHALAELASGTDAPTVNVMPEGVLPADAIASSTSPVVWLDTRGHKELGGVPVAVTVSLLPPSTRMAVIGGVSVHEIEAFLSARTVRTRAKLRNIVPDPDGNKTHNLLVLDIAPTGFDEPMPTGFCVLLTPPDITTPPVALRPTPPGTRAPPVSAETRALYTPFPDAAARIDAEIRAIGENGRDVKTVHVDDTATVLYDQLPAISRDDPLVAFRSAYQSPLDPTVYLIRPTPEARKDLLCPTMRVAEAPVGDVLQTVRGQMHVHEAQAARWEVERRLCNYDRAASIRRRDSFLRVERP